MHLSAGSQQSSCSRGRNLQESESGVTLLKCSRRNFFSLWSSFHYLPDENCVNETFQTDSRLALMPACPEQFCRWLRLLLMETAQGASGTGGSRAEEGSAEPPPAAAFCSARDCQTRMPCREPCQGLNMEQSLNHTPCLGQAPSNQVLWESFLTATSSEHQAGLLLAFILSSPPALPLHIAFQLRRISPSLRLQIMNVKDTAIKAVIKLIRQRAVGVVLPRSSHRFLRAQDDEITAGNTKVKQNHRII